MLMETLKHVHCLLSTREIPENPLGSYCMWHIGTPLSSTLRYLHPMVHPPQHVLHKLTERTAVSPNNCPGLSNHHGIQKWHQERLEHQSIIAALKMIQHRRLEGEIRQEKCTRECSQETCDGRMDER